MPQKKGQFSYPLKKNVPPANQFNIKKSYPIQKKIPPTSLYHIMKSYPSLNIVPPAMVTFCQITIQAFSFELRILNKSNLQPLMSERYCLV